MNRRVNGWRLPRRTFLRAGGVALGLPLLNAMEASAARPPPKRLVVIYTPNGTIPKNFWPAGSGSDFALSTILRPLEAHRRDLTLLGGIDILTGNRGPGDPHQRGTGACLTGAPLMNGTFSGDNNEAAGWASSISIDQHVANAIGRDTPYRSLEFGVMVGDPTVRGRVSYAGPGRPMPPENSPRRLYERVFEPGLSVAEKALHRQRRRKVVDRLRSQYLALRARVGQEDQRRLESHIESLVEVDKQLSRPGIEFGGATCSPVEVPDFGESFDYGRLPEVGKAQLDLMSLVLACGVTNVVSLMWTHSQSTASYPIPVRFGGRTYAKTGGHHGLAHKGDDEAEFIAKNTAINRFFAKNLAYLVERLKSVPEGEGTLFDSTLVLWTNEQSKGNSHDMGDMPYVLAGSAGGALRAGQYLRFAPELAARKRGQKGVSHNRLLETLSAAMGVSVGEGFGDTTLGTGVLPGLLV